MLGWAAAGGKLWKDQSVGLNFSHGRRREKRRKRRRRGILGTKESNHGNLGTSHFHENFPIMPHKSARRKENCFHLCDIVVGRPHQAKQASKQPLRESITELTSFSPAARLSLRVRRRARPCDRAKESQPERPPPLF